MDATLILQPQLTQEILKTKLKKSLRVGATENIDRRHKEYATAGYEGKMWFAKTENMAYAEDKLLSECTCPKNIKKKSNNKDTCGYIYVITAN